VAEEISRVRRGFFVDAGAHAGRVLSDAELDALDQLDDADALDMALPTLTPSERTELLWALRLSVRALAPRFSNDFGTHW
jgi:hypothetical protein